MSVNDTDEWASMIINEILEESKALEKISMRSSTNNMELIDKHKSTEIPDRDIDSTRSKFENFKDQLVDLPHTYKEIRAKNDLMTNGQNITSDHNMKSKIKMLKMADVTEMETDSSGKTFDKKLKNDDFSTSQFEMENSKEKLLIDLDEAFILDSEMHSTKTEESLNMNISFLSENMNGSSKALSEMSNLKSDIPDSISLQGSHWSYDEKKNDFPLMVGDKMSENSFKKFCLRNNDSDIPVQFDDNNYDFDEFRDKTECQVRNMSAGDQNLKPRIGFSQDEYLNRIDKKIKRVGFRNLQKENNESVKNTDSQIDLYFQWFEKNYVKEEVESHLKPTDEFAGNNCLAVNSPKIVSTKNFKNVCVVQNSNENAKNVDTGDEVRKKWNLKMVVDEDIDDSQKNENYDNLERKYRFVSGESLEGMNEKLATTNHLLLSDINIQKSLGINKRFGGFSEHHIFKNNKIKLVKGNSSECIVAVGQGFERKQGGDEIEEDVEEIDGDELHIRNQKASLVVARYRDICLHFEIMFVRPFAYLLADTYEWITFFFFLIICVFVWLFNRAHFLISNYVVRNVKNFLDSYLYEKENMIINTDETTKSALASDRMSIVEDKISEINEMAVAELSPEKITDVKMCQNINSWVNVEPEEIEIVSMNCEFASETAINLFEKVEHFLTISCNTEQHRATIKTSAEFLTAFEFINNGENHENELRLPENDFDMEIIASSNSYGVKETDVREIQKSTIIAEIGHQYEYDSHKINSHICLAEILPGISCGDEKPLFNSTAVDGSETESVSQRRRCSRLDVLSALNMVNTEECFKMQVYPRNSPERRYLNSSLNVNLPSFSSRSDILSESAPLLENSESFDDDKCIESADSIEILKELKKEERNESLLLSSLHMSAIADFQNTSVFAAKNCFKKEKDEESVESVKEMSIVNSHITRHNSGFFSVSDISDVYVQNISHSERSLMCGDTKFISGLPNPSNQLDLPRKDETASNDVTGNHKQKSKLRRRMSEILDNWKAMQSLTSCKGKHFKSKKKHNANDDTKGK